MTVCEDHWLSLFWLLSSVSFRIKRLKKRSFIWKTYKSENLKLKILNKLKYLNKTNNFGYGDVNMWFFFFANLEGWRKEEMLVRFWTELFTVVFYCLIFLIWKQLFIIVYENLILFYHCYYYFFISLSAAPNFRRLPYKVWNLLHRLSLVVYLFMYFFRYEYICILFALKITWNA